MIEEGQAATRLNDKGYVTSVCYSPTLKSMIGLAFLENGQAKIGEKVRAVDSLRGFDTLCEVVSTHFFDPEGGRLRG